LPAIADLTLANQAAVTEARSAYAALNAMQQGYVSKLATLTAAETKLADLQVQADVAAFKTAHTIILGKTTDTVSIADKAAVSAALSDYTALGVAVQTQLTGEKALLDSLEDQIEVLETKAADHFKSTQSEILNKTTETVVLEDKTALIAAQSAFAQLSEGTQAKLTAEKTLLDNLAAQIAALETAAVNNFKSNHSTILEKTVDTIAIGDKTALVAAQTAYASCNDAIKTRLATEKALLDSLATKLTVIENAKATLLNTLFDAATEKSRAMVSIDGTDVPAIRMWVTQEDMDSFNTAITTAQTAHDDAMATDASLTKAINILITAITTFATAMQPGSRSVYITPTPGQVTVAVQFNQTIVLTLSSGSFIDGIGAEHITLGGDLTGISVGNVTKTSSNTISIQLSGVLTRNTGIGMITIAAAGTTENNVITANVAVNPLPPPAAALNGLSIREGIDGAGQELIIGFDPYNLSYSLQVEKEINSVKVMVTAAPGTKIKVCFDSVEVTDGIIVLDEGINTVYVVVSEANRYDRIYEITIQRGLIDECFIATAAFGSKFEPAVAMLRHFRDQYLLTNKPGTAFVKFYYHNSPPLAAWIADSDNLRLYTRIALTPIIAVVYLIYHPAAAAVTGLLLLLLMIFWFKRRRRKLI